MKALLDRGADANISIPAYEGSDADNLSPLFLAVLSGKRATVKLLLEHGADVSPKTNWNPLVYMLETRNALI